MQIKTRTFWLAAAGCAVVAGCATTPPGPKEMTFFVTSVGPGKGGNLGGLAGADQHCQSLARAAGAGDRTWRAYLSTQGSSLSDPNFVNARDRIGTGPWQNAKGVVIARSVDELHSADNNLTKETTLDERGRLVNGRTENPMNAARRHGVPGPSVSRHDLRELDQGGERWRRHGWTSRSCGPHQRPMGHDLELVAPDAWLQPGAGPPHRR
jgi:hypothetical protein